MKASLFYKFVYILDIWSCFHLKINIHLYINNQNVYLWVKGIVKWKAKLEKVPLPTITIFFKWILLVCQKHNYKDDKVVKERK